MLAKESSSQERLDSTEQQNEIVLSRRQSRLDEFDAEFALQTKQLKRLMQKFKRSLGKHLQQ